VPIFAALWIAGNVSLDKSGIVVEITWRERPQFRVERFELVEETHQAMPRDDGLPGFLADDRLPERGSR
jgi:hypothetical protein